LNNIKTKYQYTRYRWLLFKV